MNKSLIAYILGKVLIFESIFLLLPVLVALVFREREGWFYFLVSVIALLFGLLLSRKKTNGYQLFAKDGLVTVALAWIILSLVGACPFYLTGEIPFFIDALFESVSGFTTTGATILSDVESVSHASNFWRCFSHWIGGMGVFVLILAVIPMTGGYHMHLMRAESPGPSVGKLVPKVRETAMILYSMYFVLTMITFIALLLARMPIFDALCTAFGAAGTGGFGIKNDSMASYSLLIQAIVTVAMMLFGVNFNAYFFLLGKHKKEVFKVEEVRWYFIIILVAILVIAYNTRAYFSTIFLALHHSAFQVGSIITTTGYSTLDFDTWPSLSKMILIGIMLTGACAGSTGGGIKVSRIMILFKSAIVEVSAYLHPRLVKVIKMDEKVLDKQIIKSVRVFIVTYLFIFALAILLISIDNYDFETNFTAVVATFNNIGPGFHLVGPTQNFGLYSGFSKLVLTFCMLAGRLELYPMLVLFTPSVWKHSVAVSKK